MAEPLTMRRLAVEAGIEKNAGLWDALKSGGDKLMKGMGWGGTHFLPTVVAGLGTAGAAGALLGPTLKTTGENFHNRIYPDSDSTKIRMKALAEFDAAQTVKALDKHLRDKANIPQMEDVVSRLKRTDPVLADAARDPRLRAVMDKTIQSVYSFAPDLAKDDRAMQSILTEAVSSPEGGLSFQTIRSLAETQKFLSQKG